jgi:clan AA aspartic protease (TIGR02281 family)
MRCFPGAVAVMSLALFAVAANAGSIDSGRIAAIDQAADAFLARAADAHKSREVPRQSDPAVRGLLDTVFDTSDLSHGPVPIADLGKLDDWLARVVKIGSIYLSAGHAVHDLGLFGAELGRFVDASIVLEQAIADCMTAELAAHPGEQPSPADLSKLARLRTAISGSLTETIGLFRAPRISGQWVYERVTSLRAAAPSLARFLTPAELAQLRSTVLQLAAAMRDRTLRQTLGNLAEALAAPAPPNTVPAEAAAGAAEIALESDGQGYVVPVRINGALTVKFIVDSGAGVVVLPSDLVETLTRAGAIAPGDTLGRDVYVTADGRKHKGTRLMLRELNVGGHTVTNVVASIAPAGAEPLLGQSFLAKFKSWTLDNRRHVLIISE